MADVVIKADRDVDLYVIWSTEWDRPEAWGTREKILARLTEEFERRFPGAEHNAVTDPRGRLDRADATGTSAAGGGFCFFGAWDHEALVYEELGLLPRAKLADAIAALDINRPDLVWPLLEPFEAVPRG